MTKVLTESKVDAFLTTADEVLRSRAVRVTTAATV